MLVVKNLLGNAGGVRDSGLIPELERSAEGGRAQQPLPCSYLENPMDRGAWRAKIQRVTKSCIGLKWLSTAKHNTLLSRCTTVYLSIYLLKDILDASKFGIHDIRCSKYLCVDFCVDITFQLIWVNSKECSCWNSFFPLVFYNPLQPSSPQTSLIPPILIREVYFILSFFHLFPPHPGPYSYPRQLMVSTSFQST